MSSLIYVVTLQQEELLPFLAIALLLGALSVILAMASMVEPPLRHPFNLPLVLLLVAALPPFLLMESYLGVAQELGYAQVAFQPLPPSASELLLGPHLLSLMVLFFILILCSVIPMVFCYSGRQVQLGFPLPPLAVGVDDIVPILVYCLAQSIFISHTWLRLRWELLYLRFWRLFRIIRWRLRPLWWKYPYIPHALLAIPLLFLLFFSVALAYYGVKFASLGVESSRVEGGLPLALESANRSPHRTTAPLWFNKKPRGWQRSLEDFYRYDPELGFAMDRPARQALGFTQAIENSLAHAPYGRKSNGRPWNNYEFSSFDDFVDPSHFDLVRRKFSAHDPEEVEYDIWRNHLHPLNRSAARPPGSSLEVDDVFKYQQGLRLFDTIYGFNSYHRVYSDPSTWPTPRAPLPPYWYQEGISSRDWLDYHYDPAVEDFPPASWTVPENWGGRLDRDSIVRRRTDLPPGQTDFDFWDLSYRGLRTGELGPRVFRRYVLPSMEREYHDGVARRFFGARSSVNPFGYLPQDPLNHWFPEGPFPVDSRWEVEPDPDEFFPPNPHGEWTTHPLMPALPAKSMPSPMAPRQGSDFTGTSITWSLPKPKFSESEQLPPSRLLHESPVVRRNGNRVFPSDLRDGFADQIRSGLDPHPRSVFDSSSSEYKHFFISGGNEFFARYPYYLIDPSVDKETFYKAISRDRFPTATEKAWLESHRQLLQSDPYSFELLSIQEPEDINFPEWAQVNSQTAAKLYQMRYVAAALERSSAIDWELSKDPTDFIPDFGGRYATAEERAFWKEVAEILRPSALPDRSSDFHSTAEPAPSPSLGGRSDPDSYFDSIDQKTFEAQQSTRHRQMDAYYGISKPGPFDSLRKPSFRLCASPSDHQLELSKYSRNRPPHVTTYMELDDITPADEEAWRKIPPKGFDNTYAFSSYLYREQKLFSKYPYPQDPADLLVDAIREANGTAEPSVLPLFKNPYTSRTFKVRDITNSIRLREHYRHGDKFQEWVWEHHHMRRAPFYQYVRERREILQDSDYAWVPRPLTSGPDFLAKHHKESTRKGFALAQRYSLFRRGKIVEDANPELRLYHRHKLRDATDYYGGSLGKSIINFPKKGEFVESLELTLPTRFRTPVSASYTFPDPSIRDSDPVPDPTAYHFLRHSPGPKLSQRYGGDVPTEYPHLPLRQFFPKQYWNSGFGIPEQPTGGFSMEYTLFRSLPSVSDSFFPLPDPIPLRDLDFPKGYTSSDPTIGSEDYSEERRELLSARTSLTRLGPLPIHPISVAEAVRHWLRCFNESLSPFADTFIGGDSHYYFPRRIPRWFLAESKKAPESVRLAKSTIREIHAGLARSSKGPVPLQNFEDAVAYLRSISDASQVEDRQFLLSRGFNPDIPLTCETNWRALRALEGRYLLETYAAHFTDYVGHLLPKPKSPRAAVLAQLDPRFYFARLRARFHLGQSDIKQFGRFACMLTDVWYHSHPFFRLSGSAAGPSLPAPGSFSDMPDLLPFRYLSDSPTAVLADFIHNFDRYSPELFPDENARKLWHFGTMVIGATALTAAIFSTADELLGLGGELGTHVDSGLLLFDGLDWDSVLSKTINQPEYSWRSNSNRVFRHVRTGWKWAGKWKPKPEDRLHRLHPYVKSAKSTLTATPQRSRIVRGLVSGGWRLKPLHYPEFPSSTLHGAMDRYSPRSTRMRASIRLIAREHMKTGVPRSILPSVVAYDFFNRGCHPLYPPIHKRSSAAGRFPKQLDEVYRTTRYDLKREGGLLDRPPARRWKYSIYRSHSDRRFQFRYSYLRHYSPIYEREVYHDRFKDQLREFYRLYMAVPFADEGSGPGSYYWRLEVPKNFRANRQSPNHFRYLPPGSSKSAFRRGLDGKPEGYERPNGDLLLHRKHGVRQEARHREHFQLRMQRAAAKRMLAKSAKLREFLYREIREEIHQLAKSQRVMGTHGPSFTNEELVQLSELAYPDRTKTSFCDVRYYPPRLPSHIPDFFGIANDDLPGHSVPPYVTFDSSGRMHSWLYPDPRRFYPPWPLAAGECDKDPALARFCFYGMTREDLLSPSGSRFLITTDSFPFPLGPDRFRPDYFFLHDGSGELCYAPGSHADMLVRAYGEFHSEFLRLDITIDRSALELVESSDPVVHLPVDPQPAIASAAPQQPHWTHGIGRAALRHVPLPLLLLSFVFFRQSPDPAAIRRRYRKCLFRISVNSYVP